MASTPKKQQNREKQNKLVAQLEKSRTDFLKTNTNKKKGLNEEDLLTEIAYQQGIHDATDEQRWELVRQARELEPPVKWTFLATALGASYSSIIAMARHREIT